MRKVLFLLLLGALSAVSLMAAPKSVLEDSSLVRISTPEARTAFLDKAMKDRLGLSDKEYAKVAAINAKYEQQLQDITIANSTNPFDDQVKKKQKGNPFENLSAARDKEMKKALSCKRYKNYDKQRLEIRDALKEQMLFEKAERDRVAEELARRAALELAQAEALAQEQAQAHADSVAAAQREIKRKHAAMRGNSWVMSVKQAPAKKSPAKKK